MAFADPIVDMITYLEAQVPGLPFSSDIPNPRPTEFAQVRRIGGVADPPVREIVRYNIYTWAASPPRAYELLMLIRAAIWTLPGGTDLGYPCYKVVEFMGPTMTQDSQSGVPQGWYRPEITIRSEDVIHYSA